MLNKTQFLEIKYSIIYLWENLVGFCQGIKYIIKHLNFMMSTDSARIWDSCYLIDLIEFRLILLKDCIQEEIDEIIDSNKSELIKDRRVRLTSILDCLYQLEVYRDTTIELEEPDFMVGLDPFTVTLTKKQEKVYTRYIKDSYKLQNKSLKKFFSIMGENIENWYV